MILTRRSRIVLAVIAVLVVIRLLIPVIALKVMNDELEKVSDIYQIHIGGLHLSFIRGAYRLEDLTVRYKERTPPFARADFIDVAVSWRRLFEDQVVATNVVVSGAEVIITKELMNSSEGSEDKSKSDAKTVGHKLFPVEIESVVLQRSSLQLAEVINLQAGERWRLTNLEAHASNLTPDSRAPFALVTARGTFMDSALIKLAARAEPKVKPLPWEAQIEIQGFDLVKANTLLMRMLPLNFGSGTADVYAGLRSMDGKMEGYAKPFFKNVKVFPRTEHFVSGKHFMYEILAAVANFLLKSPNDKAVATRIPFSYSDGKFHLDVKETIGEAIDHRLKNDVQPGLEDSLKLPEPKKL